MYNLFYKFIVFRNNLYIRNIDEYMINIMDIMDIFGEFHIINKDNFNKFYIEKLKKYNYV